MSFTGPAPPANIMDTVPPTDILPIHHHHDSSIPRSAETPASTSIAMDNANADKDPQTEEFAMSAAIDFQPSNQHDAVDGSAIGLESASINKPAQSSTQSPIKSSTVPNKNKTKKVDVIKNGTGSSAVLREYLKRLSDLTETSRKDSKRPVSLPSLLSIVIV